MGFVPITISAGQNPLSQFDGKVETHFLKPPAGTAFQILQIYKSLPEGDKSGAYRGPPPHFHLHQTERFRVVKGRIGVEINEHIKILRPGDEVAVCPAGNIHRFIVDVLPEHESSQNGVIDGPEWDGESILMVNATDSGKDFVLDRIFLENWYGVRVDSFKYGSSIDFIQQCAVSSIK
ncbi:Oxidoreductase OpS7 [Elasticomyces elasticus]|nr:Oxidoreductase OpS7 [Elasticomyces elasticus]